MEVYPMYEHYEAVLADLKQMKADAEAGIAAIERLMARGEDSKVNVGTAPKANINNGFQALADSMEMSVPQRIAEILGAQPGKSFTIAELVRETGVKNVQTLRGALGRMVMSGKAGKQGRGKYCAPRQSRISPITEGGAVINPL
jgi:hypothetical protein